MGIFDFWKRRKLNNLILRLKEDFNEEIRDFEHFKELQAIKKSGINSLKLLEERKKEVMKNALLQKGIKLPQTSEEFTNMLPRYAR